MIVLPRRALLALQALALPARAQTARPPAGPITMIVGFAAGGLGDITTRALAEAIRAREPVQIIVENRVGASGAVAIERIARATPDGATVGLYTPSAVWIIPNMQTVTYDPLTQLLPLGQITVQPLPIYVRADSRFRSWAEVLRFARANPGRFSWGTAGARGIAEISTEAAFRHEAVQTTTVPFRGGSEAIAAMLGGHVDAVASTDFGPLLRAGEVRLLVETGPVPPAGQDIPNFRTLGYPIAEPVAYGILGPTGIPAPVVAWWDAALTAATRHPDFQAMADRNFAIVAHESAAQNQASFHRSFEAFRRALSTQR